MVLIGKVALLGVVPSAFSELQIQEEGCASAVLAWCEGRVISGAMGRKTNPGERLLERTKRNQIQHYLNASNLTLIHIEHINMSVSDCKQ